MLSCVWLFVTPWMVARQAPLSMGFSRQGYCHGLPFPPQRDLPNPGIEPRSPASQAECLPFEPPGKGKLTYWVLRHPYCLPLWFPKQRVRFLASRQDTGRVFFLAMWFSQWKKKKKKYCYQDFQMKPSSRSPSNESHSSHFVNLISVHGFPN